MEGPPANQEAVDPPEDGANEAAAAGALILARAQNLPALQGAASEIP